MSKVLHGAGTIAFISDILKNQTKDEIVNLYEQDNDSFFDHLQSLNQECKNNQIKKI